jgi:hypothetical protein
LQPLLLLLLLVVVVLQGLQHSSQQVCIVVTLQGLCLHMMTEALCQLSRQVPQAVTHTRKEHKAWALRLWLLLLLLLLLLPGCWYLLLVLACSAAACISPVGSLMTIDTR